MQTPQPKALTSRDRDYLASALALATEFRQLSTEWKNAVNQGSVALKSARTSAVRAVADLTVIVDQLQDILSRMSSLRLKLIEAIQKASPPDTPSLRSILQSQVDKQQAEILAQERRDRYRSENPDDSEPESEPDLSNMGQKTLGYIPSRDLIRHVIPGTLATPIDLMGYLDHVVDQTMDEMELKESLLEALETIRDLKDSGEDELPSLLDQQLTNMTLVWELEPYLETVPERNEVEGQLGIMSWQMEKVK
ncbi:hypothetical protein EMPS_05801 [Entomortierella parvispora]|uniref:Uncharacterized protein n=1 Tax=Entomortierella parvispora TaxID=205924 RepID=A0A9P3HBN0_9FUNG|nr:hypothetical protein EMPS_05801 [Entomortierella parvispora]